MKPFRQHIAIAVDGGGIKGVIGIAEAAEFIAEIAEGAISASSASFSGFSGSPLPHPGSFPRRVDEAGQGSNSIVPGSASRRGHPTGPVRRGSNSSSMSKGGKRNDRNHDF